MAERTVESGSGHGPLVVIVTGLSGAGRTTAITALEDLGYEAVNNFPLALVDALVAPVQGTGHPIAIGVETRTRGFSTRALSAVIERLRAGRGPGARLVFLDCADEVLIARFSQTRRRHPLAPAEDPATGIARERDILQEIRAQADAVIDTSDMTPHQLKAEIGARFALSTAARLAVTLLTFSYKRGTPHEADMVFDCRFLRNPYWDETLRELDGRDPRIQAFVAEDPLFPAFFERLAGMVTMLLPAYRAEGKAYLGIALGCTGGRHRSVTVAERLGAHLRAEGWPVLIRHRELDRRGQAG